ncbi:epidermal growth factor receptor kinase substrate 8-like protein 3 isoform X2 [Astyanax mexicanus]|uniref:Epidermal growth factor receptor kinase substrate 8-like protein 3 isoform X2 n=1 Tax=Astyanax mexicanus TaxID=7994 RepID=A0A8T2LIP9_ASTMX|nr:epidermal growth factor receptor kinase substrate 8-like protein 3 isoform X2 [Astyanax mexicanus]
MYGNISGSDYQPRLDMSRPSAKSIYMQRKEYSESVNKQPDAFQYRVEHLFTSELDNRELSSIDDCVAKLKSLESRGKVWGQDMILQVQGTSLQLCDIESKEVLESIPLGSISQTKTILDSCTYDSLLAVTVQGNRRGPPKIFFFQCEETGAEEVRGDLDRAILHSDDPGFQPNEPMMDIRTNLENIIGQGYSMGFRRPGLSPMQPAPASPPPAPEFPPPQLNTYQEYGKEYGKDYEDPVFVNRDDARYSPEIFEPPSRSAQPSPPPPPLGPQYTDIDRCLFSFVQEIFNHVIDDIEIFKDKVGEALGQETARKKKKKKDKTPRRYGENFPSIQEYISCLQKFKYAFNILAKVSDHLRNPEAPEFVHCLFISLSYLVTKFPPDVPGSILSPFLTEAALQLLTQIVTPEEDRLWSSFGDTWHVPRSKWPNGDKMAPYVPVFYDGWEPPMPVPPQYTPPVNRPPSRSGSQRFPERRSPQPPPPQDNRPFGAPPARSDGPPLYMRVMYDFTARNRQELSVLKGEVVQVVDKSRQWWIVRNNRQEEGHVPQNVLEPMSGEEPARTNRPPNLDTRSSPEEVRNWLQYKGFSKATVRNLGMMNGALLLRMKRDDMRAVCPEEGGRVFFQLQAVKSAMALASEAEYNQYGSR